MSTGRKLRIRQIRRIRERIIMLVIGIIIGLFLFQLFAVPANADNRSQKYKYYTGVFVRPGDNLWSIAEDYITDDYESMDSYIAEVMQMNHMSDTQVRAGNYLYVPYYSEELLE